MDEKQTKYRTRSQVKIDDEKKSRGRAKVVTEGEVTTTTTVKKVTRRPTSATVAKATTSSTTKPEKTRVSRAVSTKTAKLATTTASTSTTYARTRSTRDTNLKKVTFGDVQFSEHRDGYCVSEDDLVAITPKVTKLVNKVDKRSSRTLTKRKRQTEEPLNRDVEESQSENVQELPTTAKVEKTRPVSILKKPKIATPYRLTHASQATSLSADEGEHGLTPPRRQPLASSSHGSTTIITEKPPVELRTSAIRRPQSSTSSLNQVGSVKEKSGLSTSTTERRQDIKRAPSPVKSIQTSMTSSMVETVSSPVKRAILKPTVNEDANIDKRLLSKKTSSSVILDFDAVSLEPKSKSVMSTSCSGLSGPLRSPHRKPLEDKLTTSRTQTQEPISQSPIRRRPVDAFVSTIKDSQKVSSSLNNVKDITNKNVDPHVSLQTAPKQKSSIIPRPTARGKQASPKVEHCPSEELSEQIKPTVVRKLFDGPSKVSSQTKPAFEVFSEEDTLMDDAPDLFGGNESFDTTFGQEKDAEFMLNEQAPVDPLVTRFSEINILKAEINKIQSHEPLNSEPISADHGYKIPIDPLLFEQENASPDTSIVKTQIVALKPPAEEAPSRASSYPRVGLTIDKVGNLSLSLSETQPVKSTKGSNPASGKRKSIVDGPLNGATIFLDVHTTEGADASSSFAESLVALGARCVKNWSWSATKDFSGSIGLPDLDKIGITHVVFKDGSPRTLQKVKEAQGMVFCVGVGWAIECEKQCRWVEEAHFAVDLDFIPRGGHRRRKSMEPRALFNSQNEGTPLGPANGHVPSTPLQTKLGMHSKIIFQTCPPKERVLDWELETNPLLQRNLMVARRKSLQFRPKFGSPLAKQILASNDA